VGTPRNLRRLEPQSDRTVTRSGIKAAMRAHLPTESKEGDLPAEERRRSQDFYRAQP